MMTENMFLISVIGNIVGKTFVFTTVAAVFLESGERKRSQVTHVTHNSYSLEFSIQ